MAKLDIDLHRVSGGKKFKLESIDPEPPSSARDKREEIVIEREETLRELHDLHEQLFAERKKAMLIVLMAIDTGGKDSTIDHIFSGLNPQGCVVSSFGVPTSEEMAHDFLWRIHARVPRHGQIGIFNRSHYEDVTTQLVHKWIDKKTCKRRYEHIMDFESLLVESGTSVLKFHLRISKDEQAERLQDRLEDPTKHWKFNPDDLDDRKLWDDHQQAFEAAIEATSTDDAPWYVIPANSKWYRDAVVARVVVEHLRKLDPHFPPPVEGIEQYTVD